MDHAVAYAALIATVSLAVIRPRFTATIRFTPGIAAVLGVVVLLIARLLTPQMMLQAASIQWRPLVALTSIMVMTGVVQEVGAFDRLAARIERSAAHAQRARTFTLVFAFCARHAFAAQQRRGDPAADAARGRAHAPALSGSSGRTVAFAFAVFLAPGVAPFIVSNPMNMIVAEFAGIGFNAYAAVMVPISLVGPR